MIIGLDIIHIIGTRGSESMVDAPIQASVARSPYIDRVLPMAEARRLARRLAQGCNDALRSGPFEGVGTQKSQVRIYVTSPSEFGKNKKGYLGGLGFFLMWLTAMAHNETSPVVGETVQSNSWYPVLTGKGSSLEDMSKSVIVS